jgi:hypothetical protein
MGKTKAVSEALNFLTEVSDEINEGGRKENTLKFSSSIEHQGTRIDSRKLLGVLDCH